MANVLEFPEIILKQQREQMFKSFAENNYEVDPDKMLWKECWNFLVDHYEVAVHKKGPRQSQATADDSFASANRLAEEIYQNRPILFPCLELSVF